MSFTEQELEYLQTQPLARMATVDDRQPDVVPVALEVDGTNFWVGGGETFPATRKVRNIVAGNDLVALVVDDLVSLDPFIARGIRIHGQAFDPVQRTGIVGPGHDVRIAPRVSCSWNMAGEPAGQDWYATRKTVHDPKGPESEGA